MADLQIVASAFEVASGIKELKPTKVDLSYMGVLSTSTTSVASFE